MARSQEKSHLPLYGVGPAIVFGQFAMTGIGIALSFILKLEFAHIDCLQLPFLILGCLLIAMGCCLDLSAKWKSKLFQNVEENKLITTGVYAIVRNPVYSGAWLGCTGAVMLVNNLLLLIVPLLCWGYMSVFLKYTEEKWLADLYGREYADYCKKVNRCIPWFPKHHV